MTIKKLITSLLLLILLFVVSTTDSYAAATLSLSPVSGTFSTGQTFDTAINLNTGGASVAGVDVVINFDQTKLQLVEAIEGTILQQYIGESINNSTGVFQISGIASTQQNVFNGSGTFATLRFKAYSPGTANVTINFTAGSSTDSNVADFSTSQDILGSVTNAQYTITGSPIAIGSASTGTTTTTTTTTGSSSSLSPTSSLPVTATNFPTLALIVFGIMFVVLGSLSSLRLFQ